MIRKRNSAALLPVILALVIVAPWRGASAQTGSGQQAPEAWQKLGTAPSHLHTIASDPSSPATMYALGDEGISHSTDGGSTWQGCNRDARSMKLVTPQASQNGQVTLYATGPSGLRQSTDGCLTWKDVSSQGLSPSSSSVRWIAPYPNNPAVLYAGMDGLGGLYRSTDSGATWQAASEGLPAGAWITALAADPLNPSWIFVGLKYTGRVHPPAYVYKSTDGGMGWRSASLGIHMLPHNGGEITGFAWSGGKLFVSTAEDGLYASDDSAQSWHEATLPRRTAIAARAALPGAPEPKEMPAHVLDMLSNGEGALVINTTEGVFRSLDGAQTWQNFGPSEAEGTTASAVSLDPRNRVVIAGGGGLWGLNMPTGIVAQATVEPGAVAQAEVATPTPPPPPALPTATPPPPTPTSSPVPTATPTPVPRPEGYLPTEKAQPLDPSIAAYAAETGHNIKFGFKDYWFNNNGLSLLGYPITEEFTENGVDVQYFERGRLEYRDGKIVWGLVGSELTAGKFFQTVRFFPSEDGKVYFGPTQHSVSGPFLTFWQDNGGLETFGYPLSESFKEDGSEYQWFERARLEWHPWLPEGNRIVLGNIGTELLQKRGWLK